MIIIYIIFLLLVTILAYTKEHLIHEVIGFDLQGGGGSVNNLQNIVDRRTGER